MPFLDRDGVALHYERSGGKGRPMFLVHGWCCDQRFLAPQAGYFAGRGFDVVAPDLRGHGRSDKPEQPYTIGGFADDIAFLCGALELERPVVVGHSMGGIIAYEIARRHPGLPAAVVMLDAAVAPSDAVRSTMRQTVERLRGPGYAAALREIVAKVFFLPSDDPARRAWILDVMASAPQHVMAGAYQGLAEYDPGPTGATGVPSLYVAADEPTARADPARMRALLPDLFFGQVVGSGHFCQLEVPEQVNAMIDRFLAIALPAAPAIKA